MAKIKSRTKAVTKIDPALEAFGRMSKRSISPHSISGYNGALMPGIGEMCEIHVRQPTHCLKEFREGCMFFTVSICASPPATREIDRLLKERFKKEKLGPESILTLPDRPWIAHAPGSETREKRRFTYRRIYVRVPKSGRDHDKVFSNVLHWLMPCPEAPAWPEAPQWTRYDDSLSYQPHDLY